MDFPEEHVPTSRTYKPGSYPVKVYKAMDGSETRIMYGNREMNSVLTLTYACLPDEDAEKFGEHYRFLHGTFGTFVFSVLDTKAKGGWHGKKSSLAPAGEDKSIKWRYQEAPQIQSLYPGYSSVTVVLTGANAA